MLTCEHCRDYLLDHVYGLLEGADLQEMQAHLDACADCRAALVKVQTNKKLIARAARAISQVPEFKLPGAQPAETAVPAQQSAPAPTLPFVAPAKAKRSGWRYSWLAWGVAAAILIAVSMSVVWYRVRLQGYQTDLAQARQEYSDADAKLAALPATFEPLHAAAIKDVRAKASPYLHVVGPKTLPANAKGHLHITTRHPEGELAACKLRIKISDGAGNVVGKIMRPDSDGQAHVEFDTTGAKPDSNLNVLIEAEAALGQTRLHETVAVQAPAYVTRIDTNKTIYQMKDVLFFRVLVLDRTTLQPPGAEIALRVALVHDKKTLRAVEHKTGAGGILAAEFAVEENLPEGSYTLEVNPADVGKTNVQTASAPLEIVRQLPGIRLDQNRYLPGAVVKGELNFGGGQPIPANLSGKLDVDGKAIPVTIQPQLGGGRGGAPAPAAKKGATVQDAAKAASVAAFSAPIPAAVPAGVNQLPLTLQWPEGKKNKEIRTFVPLEPTEFAVDFFPEGGDLIAGVPNRVFFSIRSITGVPINSDGHVILLTSKNDIVDSPYQLGMGVFDFTPDAGETYSVRITTPLKVQNVAEPFKKLGIRRAGVVLHVPTKAVGKQGEPIRVTLRRQGEPRKLLLVALCRGQIVDQRWVEVAQGSIDLTLQPTPEARGMIRVIAYEAVGATLEPVAERLVYRASTHRLDLAFITPNGQQYQPGSKIKATVHAKDENGQPTPTWILASVVDERFQAKPRSLSAHFLLLNELRTGADLDNAQIILHDSPESVQVLERFLGTHGWRRYVPVGEPAAVDALAVAVVFSRENMPLEKVQKNYEKKLASVLAPLRAAADKKLKERQAVLATAAANINNLAEQLTNFEEQVQLWIRLTLGFILALLLVATLILMGNGAYRLLRGREAATPAFGSAFACLVACLGIIMVGTFLGPMPSDVPPVLDAKGPNLDALDQQLAQGPAVQGVNEEAPMGTYRLGSERKEAENQHPLNAAAPKKANEKLLTNIQNQQMVMNLAVPGRAEAGGSTFGQANALRDKKLAAIFEAAANEADRAKGTPARPGKIVPAAAGNGGRRLEYSYQSENGGTADTLLWHPTLWLANGNGEVHFDIPSGSNTYRVILLGHSAAGRFGFYETRLDVPALQGR